MMSSSAKRQREWCNGDSDSGESEGDRRKRSRLVKEIKVGATTASQPAAKRSRKNPAGTAGTASRAPPSAQVAQPQEAAQGRPQAQEKAALVAQARAKARAQAEAQAQEVKAALAAQAWAKAQARAQDQARARARAQAQAQAREEKAALVVQARTKAQAHAQAQAQADAQAQEEKQKAALKAQARVKAQAQAQEEKAARAKAQAQAQEEKAARAKAQAQAQEEKAARVKAQAQAQEEKAARAKAQRVAGSKPAVDSWNSAISVARNLSLKGVLLLGVLFWAWVVWTFADLTASGIRTVVGVGRVRDGEPSENSIARSLVGETHEMRSAWNVFVQRRQHLSEEEAMNEEMAATLGSLKEVMAGLDEKLGILRQQVESSVASSGSQDMALSYLSEVQDMTEALKAQQGMSENMAAGQERMTGEERGYQEGVATAAVDLTDGTEVVRSSAISRQEMEELVRREVEIFASGGLKDYASLAGGASVVRGRGLTSPAMTRDRVAEEALSASTLLGHCFAFSGGSGKLTIRLGGPNSQSVLGGRSPDLVDISKISIAHASVAAVPSAAKSAPRIFRVLGWNADPIKNQRKPHVLLSRGEYSVEPGAPALQIFEASSPTPVGWVTLEIESNHGGPWTCVYGFRVHGREAAVEEGGGS